MSKFHVRCGSMAAMICHQLRAQKSSGPGQCHNVAVGQRWRILLCCLFSRTSRLAYIADFFCPGEKSSDTAARVVGWGCEGSTRFLGFAVRLQS